MVSRWDKTRDELCPDCGTRETTDHLMRCPGHLQTLLVKEQVDGLECWMAKNETDGDIAFWIPKFILMRNARALSSFPNLPPKLTAFAADQYAIGWREFTEGRIEKSLFAVQKKHLNKNADTTSIKRWTKCFITQLLHIT